MPEEPAVDWKRLPVLPDDTGHRPIAPTDVSQFIRLDQCRRYLRLRLHERAHRRQFDFMLDYDVTRQSIPPLLSRSGERFERETEARIPSYLRLNLAEERRATGGRPDDNARVVETARSLGRGEVQILLQPRLQAEIGGWRIRGDIDILRLERDAAGDLQLLIADMKSSTSTKVEHRLQVAFYHEMVTSILTEAGIAHAPITLAVHYRGPSQGDSDLTDDDREKFDSQREAADRLLWAKSGYLEIIENQEHYIGAVHEQVTDPSSVAQQVAEAEFEALPWHLTYKCDGCLYNEYCMKRAAEEDDLSLLPYLSATDKTALRGLGITTTHDLVALKIPKDGDLNTLVPAPGKADLNRRVATTWPIGPRADELVHRARRYRRFQGDDLTALPYIPNKGHDSLPYCDAEHNPNLVRIYIDAQHDYLYDRVYLLGALVTACENGEQPSERRRSIVCLSDGQPSTPKHEEDLFLKWITRTMAAVRDLAAPDAEGNKSAPIHLIFFDAYAQRIVLEGLSRHFTRVLGATPLYDFMTQLAAFDSPVISLLEQEIRERRNMPMICQSLQSVARFLKFDWGTPEPFNEIFRVRMFDFRAALTEDESGNPTEWYTSRARFNSQIPLEYAYAAYGDLDSPEQPGSAVDYRSYRGATLDLLRGFAARRLEAVEWIARSFRGNDRTTKTSFDLTTLDTFEGRARSLAEALCEFVTIERHVDLAEWKRVRLLPPERRVLTGETLLVRYHDTDQDPGVAEENREHARRQALREGYEAAFRVANPGEPKVKLTSQQNAEVKWSNANLELNLRIVTSEIGVNLDEIQGLSGFEEGQWVVIYPRWAIDTRLPEDERTPFQPTPKQMLHGMRGEILRFTTERDATGALVGLVRLRINGAFGGNQDGFLFWVRNFPLADGELYSIDPNPSDIYGFWQHKVVEGLHAGGGNELHRRLLDLDGARVDWPEAAMAGQRRFLEGLEALHRKGLIHGFGSAQREYVGQRADEPVLLVQGPPGTGKSYSTAFAVFARFQGAIAAGREFRVVASCKTHAATDVLLADVAGVREKLARWRREQPELFARYFDERLLDVSLFRIQPREEVADPIIPLHKKGERPEGQGDIHAEVLNARWCFAAATPGGVYRMMADGFKNSIFGHEFIDCLVLDEASQMNLPEALMAALPLRTGGQVIIVGDHRQMPPIVKHDWAGEPRRTFQEYRTYESLFQTFRDRGLRMVQFDESFRLHRDMAEFLRREIYQHDGIAFFARHTNRLDPIPSNDPFVAAVLDPDAPIVVVVHEEARSQLRNEFEQALITPVLEAIAACYDDPGKIVGQHLGVVVPHRAQRAAVQAGVQAVSVRDPVTGLVTMSSVDTVERFQGGERDAIMVSATESDPDYLLISTKFLLDPRRLTVALSRAKRKLILVASRSVFNVFSADEETFEHAQIWKNLLRHTCTTQLWAGSREHHESAVLVEVWGLALDD